MTQIVQAIVDEVTWDDWREALDVMASPAAYRRYLAENIPANIPAKIIGHPDEPFRPKPHVWETRTLTEGLTVEACIHGDAIRRRDDQHQPCRGPGRIDLRRPALTDPHGLLGDKQRFAIDRTWKRETPICADVMPGITGREPRCERPEGHPMPHLHRTPGDGFDAWQPLDEEQM